MSIKTALEAESSNAMRDDYSLFSTNRIWM